MASRVHWSELRIGLLSAAAILVAVLSILLFARVGALHGDTKQLYVTVDHAPGVLKGTDVWLLGRKIGLVKNITFRPITVDTLQRVAIETEICRILSAIREFLRRNSRRWKSDRQPGVYIDPGTTDALQSRAATRSRLSAEGKVGRGRTPD